MERRNFFKILAGAIGASVVAPRVLAEKDVFTEKDYDDAVETLGIKDPAMYPLTYDDYYLPSGYTIEEILRIYRETGMLIYQS